VDNPGRRNRWFLPWGGIESAPRRSFQNTGEAGKEMNQESAAQQMPCKRKCKSADRWNRTSDIFHDKFSSSPDIKSQKRALCSCNCRLQTFRF